MFVRFSSGDKIVSVPRSDEIFFHVSSPYWMARDSRRIGTYESCVVVGTLWSVEEEEGRAPSSIFEISKYVFLLSTMMLIIDYRCIILLMISIN